MVDALATPVVGVLADKYGTKKAWHLAGELIFISLKTRINVFAKCFATQMEMHCYLSIFSADKPSHSKFSCH